MLGGYSHPVVIIINFCQLVPSPFTPTSITESRTYRCLLILVVKASPLSAVIESYFVICYNLLESCLLKLHLLIGLLWISFVLCLEYVHSFCVL